MKVNIRIQNEWFVIPVPEDGKRTTVGQLCSIALKRFDLMQDVDRQRFVFVSTDVGLTKQESSETIASSAAEVTEENENLNWIEIRKNNTKAVLDSNDLVSVTLVDNDFLVLVLEQDSSESSASLIDLPDEIHRLQICKQDTIYLDGNTLEPEELLRIGSGSHRLELTDQAWMGVKEGRDLLEILIADNKVVYGINTGFGKFANTIIDRSELEQLQRNLIRSHSSGVGRPLTIERVRRLLALRINVLAKGHSGISPQAVQQLLDAFNADCLPWVPEQGTVGASGDLAPLAHLALGFMGEGKMWSAKTGWAQASLVLQSHGLQPICLRPKEGIALINGTQLITSLGAEAVVKAQMIANQADVVAALSLEVLKGTTRAFDVNIHMVRPHSGQMAVAATLRALLHSEVFRSGIAESHRFCNKVQDAYTIRCCPQVHGVVHETIHFVRNLIQVEMNSATDNPLIFAKLCECISGGNFHGEYPAKACDYLAIGIHELASMSERRIERLVNPALSGLPPFLVSNGGLNSGFMMPHCTAAALVSENKVLCHPASIDSLSTSAGTEDHVSMGGFAARKALQVVENVEKVIAIELLAACQAIEFLRPLKTTEPLEAVYNLVRSLVKPLDSDRFMAPEIEKVVQLLRQNKVHEVVRPFISVYQTRIKELDRKHLPPERPSSPTTTFSNTHCKNCKNRIRGHGLD